MTRCQAQTPPMMHRIADNGTVFRGSETCFPSIRSFGEPTPKLAANPLIAWEIRMKPYIAALAAGTLIATGPAFAETALGLTGDKTLVMIDTATAKASGTIEVQGVNRLLGIDWRPGNGTVVGVTDDQRIVTIDPTTGATATLSTMSVPLPNLGMPVAVDVNPAADRLRVMTGTTNHRLNMETGEAVADGNLHFDASDAANGTAPMVVATAYTNAMGKPESTAMFNIDAGLSSLLRQAPPNDGTLKTVGALGVALSGEIGWDVQTTADGSNTAWLAAMGGLHTVNLETGAVTGSWAISGFDGALRDLTILPAM